MEDHLKEQVRQRFLERIDARDWGDEDPRMDLGTAALPHFIAAIKEERDCYAVSLILGVDRFAVAQADRPPREGDAPKQPAVERVRLLIPGSM